MGGGFSDNDAVQVDVGDNNSLPEITQSFEDMSIRPDPEELGLWPEQSTDTDEDKGQSRSSYSSGSAYADLLYGGGPSVDLLGDVDLSPCPSKAAWDLRTTLENQAYFSLYSDVTNTHKSQYDPASLQYMLDFFRNVAQSIPADASGSSAASPENDVVPLDPGARDDSSKRAGIIVLREDLDFYAIPHKKGIDQAEMMEVKRAAAKALLKQDGIFSGLKRSDEPGTTEAHLIEMLTAG